MHFELNKKHLQLKKESKEKEVKRNKKKLQTCLTTASGNANLLMNVCTFLAKTELLKFFTPDKN